MEKLHSNVRLYTIGSTGLFFLFSLYSFSLLSFLCKFPITNAQFYISALSVLLFCYFLSDKKIKETFITFLIVAFLFVTCCVLSGRLIDTSFDGQGYHGSGVVALNENWNPLYENIFDRLDINSSNDLWLQTYPHSSNIWVLNIYKVFGNVEYGKGVNSFLLILSFIFAYLASQRLIGDIMYKQHVGVVVASISVLNPVSLTQVFSFGLDTQTYSLLLILLSSLVLSYVKLDAYLVFNLCASIVLLVNNKLTTFVYVGCFIGVYFMYIFFQRNTDYIRRLLYVFASVFVLAFFVFGYQPYITNYVIFGNPLHPIFTHDYTETLPSNHLETNQVSLFFQSMFFKTNGEYKAPMDEARFKVPFTYSEEEVKSFIFLGPKTGGFGVYFGGVILLCTLLVILSFYYKKNYRYDYKNDILFFLITIITILLSCIINPLNSYARFIPQLWLILPVVVLYLSRFNMKVIRYGIVLIVFFVTANSFIVLNQALTFNRSETDYIDSYLKTLFTKSIAEPILVDFSVSEGNKFLLQHYNIKYIENRGDITKFTCQGGYVKQPLMPGIGNSTALMCITKTEN